MKPVIKPDPAQMVRTLLDGNTEAVYQRLIDTDNSLVIILIQIE
jgi:hypothetical protein